MRPLSSLPALRVLLPLMLGIVLADMFHAPMTTFVVAVIVIAALLIAGRRSLSLDARQRMRKWRFAALAAILVAVGLELSWWNAPRQLPRDVTGAPVLAGRIDVLDYNTRSMMMRVRLLYRVDNDGATADVGRHAATVRLSTRGCDYSLRAGDVIAWRGGLEPISCTHNPHEVDYSGLLRREGVLYEKHIERERDWTIVGYRPTWLNRMAQVRSRLEVDILSTSLRQDVQQFVIALLLGNDRFIDAEVRHDFALAGVAHVLALSGLHVGVIGAVLYFLLFPLDFIRRRRLRLVLTIVAVLVFDALTGFSPSVVRATVMMALLMAPPLLHRRSVPLNSLAVAAVLILTVTPQTLFNAGFQLSFITVGFILLFSGKIKEMAPKRKWLNVIVTTVATTLVATVSTQVLSAYYFNTLNLGTSLLANCLILPAFPLLMIAAVAVAMLAAGGGEVGWLNRVLEAMYDTLRGVVTGVNDLGWHTTYGVTVDTVTVFLFYLMLGALAAWIFMRNRRWIIVAAVSLLLITVNAVVSELQRPRHGLVVFNDFGDTPIVYFRNDTAWLWQPDRPGGTDVADFAKCHSGFMAYHNFASVVAVDSGRHAVPGGLFAPPYASLEGRRLVAVGRGQWSHTTLDNAPRLDYVIVTGRYHGGLNKLRALFPDAREYVLAGNIYTDDRTALTAALDSLRLPYRDIKRQGALVVVKK